MTSFVDFEKLAVDFMKLLAEEFTNWATLRCISHFGQNAAYFRTSAKGDGVPQLVERLIRDPKIEGSNPVCEHKKTV